MTPSTSENLIVSYQRFQSEKLKIQVDAVERKERVMLSEAGLGPGGVCHKLTSKSLNALFEDSTFVGS